MSKNVEYSSISLKERVSYGMGDFASNLIYSSMVMWLMFFYTDVYGITAASAGTLFFVARLWDSVSDPIMGVIVDKTHTKWGKARPYLLWLSIPYVIASVLVFATPNFNQTEKIIYAYVTYLLIITIFTAINIPYGILMLLMTKDSEERTILSTFRMLGAASSLFLVGILPVLVSLVGKGTSELEASRDGYFKVMIIFAIIALVMFTFTFFNTKERVGVKKTTELTFKEAISILTQNKPWFIINIFSLIHFTVEALVGASLMYYVKYVLGLSESYASIVMIIFIIGQIIGISLCPKLVSLVGKKKITILGVTISIFATIFFLVSGKAFINIAMIAFIGAISKGIPMTTIYTLLADTIEYGEYKTGVRSEGLLYSANSFVTKLAAGISGMVIGLVLDYVKYDGEMATQTPKALNGITFLFVILPIILSVIEVIVLSFYGLTEEKYKKISEELKLRG